MLGFLGYIIGLILAFLITAAVIGAISLYLERIEKGKELAEKAKKLQAEDTGNPFETGKLRDAYRTYQEANKLLRDEKLRTIEKNVAEEIEKRERFIEFFRQGKELEKIKYYKKALAELAKARELYLPPRLSSEIDNCKLQVEKENIYEARLTKARELALKGELKEARVLINQALIDFDRPDGKTLLTKIEQITIGLNYFQSGANAEQTGDLRGAIDNYKKALLTTPGLIYINRRLGIVNIKAGNYREGIANLEGINEEEAIYFRGYAHARLQEWREASKEWKKLDRPEMKEQINILALYSQREKLTLQKEIQELTRGENLELARSTSEKFLEKFGDDPQVSHNLKNHIAPRLALQLWKSKDREKIVINTRREWERKRDLESLHNLAIALYYRALENPATLKQLIPVWLSATANLNLDTGIKNIAWKVIDDGDIKELGEQLIKILEDLIDRTKEDINQYLQLRDLYRRDTVALRLLRDNPREGINIGGLTILPGLYIEHPDRDNVRLPDRFWATLYTCWGESVAACLEGDRARGISLKPRTSRSILEQIANIFVSFHQGCHYLQEKQWQRAADHLKEAKPGFKDHPEWIQEIDRLYLELQDEIEGFDNLLAMNKHWYDLVQTPSSKMYYVRYRSLEIVGRLDDNKIDESRALSELENLKSIDRDNATLNEFIEEIIFRKDAREVRGLMSSGQFFLAIERAKRSRSKKLRQVTARLCIELLLESGKNLPPHEIKQLVRWAYELCPDEPEFQEVYKAFYLI